MIALVITIIILLILVGITLSQFIGHDGLLSRSKETRIAQSNAQVMDTMSLTYMQYNIEKNSNETDAEFIEYMKEKGFILENGTINTVKFIGNKIALGNGTNSTDVYKLEKNGSKYVVNYYGESSDTADKVVWESSESSDDTSFDKKLEELEKKISSEDGDCMIDENGNIFSIDKWNYEITGDDTASVISEDTDYYETSAYKGEITTDGKLEYDIPVYIKKNKNIYLVNELGNGACWGLDIQRCNNTK